MAASSRIIGVDLGGTHLRWGVVCGGRLVTPVRKKLIGRNRSAADIMTLLEDCLTKEINRQRGHDIERIGLGIPGIVSARRKTVYASPHFPEWKNFALGSLLQRRLGIPITMDNDAHMIARGELELGVARGQRDFILVTLGTGIGGALVLNGRMAAGPLGFGGEIGHMIVEAHGRRCACGARGCWEAYVSQTALLYGIKQTGMTRLMRHKAPIQWSHDVVSLARAGHKSVKTLLRNMGFYLGVGLSSLIQITGVTYVVIGGGLKVLLPHLLPEAHRALRDCLYAETYRHLVIKRTRLGDCAGIIGAAGSIN